jgi:hypothetical protein
MRFVIFTFLFTLLLLLSTASAQEQILYTTGIGLSSIGFSSSPACALLPANISGTVTRVFMQLDIFDYLNQNIGNMSFVELSQQPNFIDYKIDNIFFLRPFSVDNNKSLDTPITLSATKRYAVCINGSSAITDGDFFEFGVFNPIWYAVPPPQGALPNYTHWISTFPTFPSDNEIFVGQMLRDFNLGYAPAITLYTGAPLPPPTCRILNTSNLSGFFLILLPLAIFYNTLLCAPTLFAFVLFVGISAIAVYKVRKSLS